MMGKIRNKIDDRALQMQQDLANQAQMRYIQWLMKEEECDYEMAIAIVMGNTDPLEPEYMLGYKLADPVLQIALFKQLSKKARMQAAQAEVEATEVEATAGGGAVKVVANGRHEFISVTIDPEVAQDDVEMLQDLMVAACNEAMRKIDELMESKMGAVTGGMGLGF